jgi:hypothetical protein
MLPGTVEIECSHCLRTLPRSDFLPSHKAGGWCRACHNSTRRDKRAGRVPARLSNVCLNCGTDIRHMRRHAKACSSKCSVELWRKNNPEYQRNATLKSVYGITEVEFQELLKYQKYTCAICGTDQPGKNGWQIDHCHELGLIRGILCLKCNVGLGNFKDDPEILSKAIHYLQHCFDEAITVDP